MRTSRKIPKRPPFTRRSIPFTVLPACRGQGPVPDQEYAAGKLMGFFAAAILERAPVYEGIYASSMV
jgi:hypothetical protein